MTAAELLAELQSRGVTVRADDGHLQVDAPRGVVTPELHQHLQEHKADLLAVLQDHQDCVAALEAELATICDAWFTVEERIFNGRRYCAAHPKDGKAHRLLAQLEAESQGLERRYNEANTRYKRLCDDFMAPRSQAGQGASGAHCEDVTLLLPADTKVPTIGGYWGRIETGEILATYTRQELELCLAVMEEISQTEVTRG